MSINSTASSRMTMEQEIRPGSRIIRDVLPWMIAAVALVLYLVTINHWISFFNLLQASKISGWTWQANLSEPVYWLVTYPFHWLPAKSVPIALNLLSVVCAVLTLALLARSVALLPHDRTLEQRQREHSEFSLLSVPGAWLAPVLAAMVCGLQLTFWEIATSGSGEMLDLLIFAYVIRCLLEFRIDERESWLTRASLVYGVGITNNWAMIGFLPLFIGALVWIRGLNFFNLRFLGQMLLCGMAGLSLYFILPLLQSRTDILTIPFWQGFRANLGNQMGTLFSLYKSARPTIALLSLTSLVPVLIIGIKWASYFGDTSKIGIALATFTFHVAHAILFIACIWVAMDPPFSPRHAGFGHPFLSFYYLGALSVGYFTGYFLLVFGGRLARSRRTPSYISVLNSIVKTVVWLLFFLVPAVLITRNLTQIRISNGPILKQIANLMTESLPAKGAIVLSDDLRRSLLAQSILAQKGQEKGFIFVDSGSFNDHLVLEYPDYHRFLKKKYGDRWPVEIPKSHRTMVPPLATIPLFSNLEQTNTLFYLHPSFGLYFERFYLEPHGLAYRFRSYTSTNPFPPLLTQELVDENEAFWNKADSQALQPLLTALSTAHSERTSLIGRFSKMTRLKEDPNRDATVLAQFYSRAMDYWGVELQKRGNLEKAAHHFTKAIELSADNIAADVNLQCNKKLQANQPTAVQLSKSVTDLFGPYRTWNNVITANGPFDEPTFCYEQAQVFIQSKYLRQAMHQFARVNELDRTHLPARLWLAQLYIMADLPGEALKLIKDLQQNRNDFKVSRTNVNELMFAEASTYLANKDRSGAEAVIEKALQQYETDKELLPKMLATASRMYLNFGVFSNALPLIDRQLTIAPNNIDALVSKGYACLQLHLFEQAVPPLTRVLQTTNYAPALLNRAIAYLRSGQLEASQADYEALLKTLPNAYPVYYGLAEIAYLQKDTNAAIRYYELYMTNASPNSEETKLVSRRLAELKPR